MAKRENKLVDEADEQYNVLTGDEEIQRLAELRLLSKMEEHSALETARQAGTEKGMEQGIKKGMEQGLQEGKKRGLKEGKEQGIKEGKKQGIKEGKEQGIKEGLKKGVDQGVKIVAKKLKAMNVNIDDIIKATGLSKKEIESI